MPDLHSVFLFGGRDESCRLNDLYRLDLYSMNWTKIEVEGDKPTGRSWLTFTFVPDKHFILVQGGFSNENQPLDDVWHLDLSEFYDLKKCETGTASVKWTQIRSPTPVVAPTDDDSSNTEAPLSEDVAAYRRFWHTANLISDAILVYGGMNQNPSISGPCLNTLSIQRLQPPSLFNLCIQSLQRNHLSGLPPLFSSLNIRRKLTLLEEIYRFKQRKNSCSYLNECNRHCPSLYELPLSTIFEILDPNVN